MDALLERYAANLQKLIQKETISEDHQKDKTKFYEFHEILKEVFPNVFRVAKMEVFDGSILICWKGKTDKEPIMFMNHHDVVEAPGEWKYPAFSGAIAEGKMWGRGTLDTKGGLWGMLQAADDLIAEGFVPDRDIYFESSCTEEVDMTGANMIASELQKRGLHFFMTLDEGGMMQPDPVSGSGAVFAMIGVGEKQYADLKFIARGNGGHASTPGKETPLVRLGRFMIDIEENNPFIPYVSPTICEMLRQLSKHTDGPLKEIMAHPEEHTEELIRLMPEISPTAGAMLATTLAFTMAQGSNGANVLPQEAWVMGNIRMSHHQSLESIEVLKPIAAKYGVEVFVQTLGGGSTLTDYTQAPYQLVAEAIGEIFPDVSISPFVMNGATDSMFMSRITDNSLRFAPIRVTDEQMATVHALNENIDLANLVPMVKFYQYIMKKEF